MITIPGIYAAAKVYTDVIEPSAEGQIRALCDQQFAAGSKIRIMPDVHTGKGCTIGTTMTVGDFVVPNLVGVDIGCGMDVVRLSEKRINLPEPDSFIRKNIPHGRDVRERPHRSHGRIDIDELICIKKVDTRRAKESLGTLGGGNHFIEIDRDDYLHDMALMQRFAALNRRIIKECILDAMKLREADFFTTIHNYIDMEHMILRKGAVSAREGERLLIPLNMRDGALICTGLGNDDWNQSAPHGAGRLFSRTQAENSFTLSAFKKSMEGIYTTSVGQDTLDECPMAYKDPQTIIDAIGDTVRIEKQIRPIYNFKSSDRFYTKKR